MGTDGADERDEARAEGGRTGTELVVPGLSDETAVDRDRPEELPWACPFLGVKTAFWPIECGNKRMIG